MTFEQRVVAGRLRTTVSWIVPTKPACSGCGLELEAGYCPVSCDLEDSLVHNLTEVVG